MTLASGSFQSAGTSAAGFAYRFAPYDPKAGLLDCIDKAIFLNGLRVVEHAREPFTEDTDVIRTPGSFSTRLLIVFAQASQFMPSILNMVVFTPILRSFAAH